MEKNTRALCLCFHADQNGGKLAGRAGDLTLSTRIFGAMGLLILWAAIQDYCLESVGNTGK